MPASDAELGAAIRLLLETTGQLAKGAGAAAVAGALGRRGEIAVRAVGLILSGGNLGIEALRRILDRQTP